MTGSIIYFRRHNMAINGVRQEFLNGQWEAGLRYFLSLTEGGSYRHPYVTRSFDRLGVVRFGCHLFAGSDDTPMGFYDANDFGYLWWEYRF